MVTPYNKPFCSRHFNYVYILFSYKSRYFSKNDERKGGSKHQPDRVLGRKDGGKKKNTMNKIHKKATIINRIKHLTNQVRDMAGRFEEGSQTKKIATNEV